MKAVGDGTVTVRYWAAARAAAGVAEEALPAGSLAAVLAEATRRHGDDLARVLGVCSFLIDADPVGVRDHATVAVHPGAVLEALPPFAGG
ncbi:MAG: thiamine S protein [Mycobacterium sp.]|nr:thiamine S protein [Mycobacterium sp.]